MTKHILVVSQYFYPEPFRINDICCELVKRGYEITVLTGIPNYPEGKFYPGYGWCEKRKEIWNGINIIRIPILPRGRSTMGLAFNYASFVVSGFFWQLFTKIKADYVFTFEVSPMTQALVGVWYAKRRKIKHCLYVQDLWPECVESVTGIHSKVLITPIRKMVDYIYKRCDTILATSPSFVEEIRKRLVDKKGKVKYWPQYAEEFYRPMEKKAVTEIPDDGKFKIVFTGNIGQAQGLDILPKAAKILKEQGIINVQFVIIGDGRYRVQLANEIAECKVQDMFLMIGRQPAQKIPEMLAACDVAFISYMKGGLFEKAIPAKLQSYMACGMPIIAAAKGEIKRVVDEAQCGICSTIDNEDDLSVVIKSMIDADLYKMKLQSRRYFEAYFDKEHLIGQLGKYFM